MFGIIEYCCIFHVVWLSPFTCQKLCEILLIPFYLLYKFTVVIYSWIKKKDFIVWQFKYTYICRCEKTCRPRKGNPPGRVLMRTALFLSRSMWWSPVGRGNLRMICPCPRIPSSPWTGIYSVLTALNFSQRRGSQMWPKFCKVRKIFYQIFHLIWLIICLCVIPLIFTF